MYMKMCENTKTLTEKKWRKGKFSASFRKGNWSIYVFLSLHYLSLALAIFKKFIYI